MSIWKSVTWRSRLPWWLRGKKSICIADLHFRRLPAMLEMQVWSFGWDDPLEKEMATYSSILAWEIPWTEEPGGHDLATKPPPPTGRSKSHRKALGSCAGSRLYALPRFTRPCSNIMKTVTWVLFPVDLYLYQGFRFFWHRASKNLPEW